MRDANGFKLSCITHQKVSKKLSVLILIRVVARSLTLIIVKIIAAHRAKTLAVTLAGVLRFELCLLSGRDKMRVLFQVFDDLFGNNLAFEAAKRAFNRFVIVY
jgi:hypothetical protein